MTQTRRPNSRVRRDWESTRRRWEAEKKRELRLDAQRRARASAAEAEARNRAAEELARAKAERSWPATPVASRYERRLRTLYIEQRSRAGDAVPPERWLAGRAPGTPDWMGDEDALMGISAAVTVLVTIAVLVDSVLDAGAPLDLWALVGVVVFAPVVFLLAWVPTGVVLAVLAFIGLVVLETAHAIRRGRQRKMWEDHLAYRAWEREVHADERRGGLPLGNTAIRQQHA